MGDSLHTYWLRSCVVALVLTTLFLVFKTFSLRTCFARDSGYEGTFSKLPKVIQVP